MDRNWAILIAIVLPLHAVYAGSVCLSGWTEYSGRCFLPRVDSTQALSAADASHFCHQLRAQLLTVHGSKKEGFIRGLLNSLHAPADSAIWSSVDETVYSADVNQEQSTRDSKRQQTGRRRQWATLCATIRRDGHTTTSSSENCGGKHGFICERSTQHVSQTNPQGVRHVCFESNQNTNSIRGIVKKPGDQNPPNTYFFGHKFTDVKQCQDACAAQVNCDSYTYFLNSYSDVKWRGVCYGRNSFDEVTVDDPNVVSGPRTPCRRVCFSTERNHNMVHNRVSSPKQDSRPNIYYFGHFGDNYTRCERACASEPNCVAYTLHTGKGIWAGTCYGRSDFENRNVPQEGVISGLRVPCRYNNVCFENNLDRSTIKGLVTKPRVGKPPNTHYFGTLADAEKCKEACAEEINCDSYSFFTQSYPDTKWRGGCYGRNSFSEVDVVDAGVTSGPRKPCQRVCFSEEPLRNMVHSRVPGPKKDDRPKTFYLGAMGSDVARCRRACAAEPKCVAFTLHLQNNRWKGLCYGRSDFEDRNVVGDEIVSGRRQPCDLKSYCPFGWRTYADGCFKYMYEFGGKTWDKATDLCQLNHAQLTIARTADAAKWLMKAAEPYVKFPYQVKQWWVGLRRKDSTSDWVWQDGVVADMAAIPWKSGQPSPKPKDNCAFMETDGFSSGPCDTVRPYICKRNSSSVMPCETNWDHVGSRCLKYVRSTDTWPNAQDRCSSEGAHLVKVNSHALSEYVVDLARFSKQDMWIGLHSWRINQALVWLWSDGTGLDPNNTYWQNNKVKPKQQNNTCACVWKNVKEATKAWRSQVCTDGERGTICERAQGTCAPGWRIHEDQCYLSVTRPEDWLSWTEARDYCRARGAQLLTIYKADEQAFINTYLEELNSVGVPVLWLGLSTLGGNTPWLWVDNNELEYVNWSPGEPKPCPKGGIAHIFTGGNGQWTTTRGFSQLHAFMCKIPSARPVVVPTTPRPNYHCPDSGWVLFGDKCYKYISDGTTWPLARFSCQLQLADLTAIASPEQNTFLSRQWTHAMWIGMHRRNKDGVFTWLDMKREPFWFNWGTRQPSKAPSANCVHMQVGAEPGTWASVECEKKFSYICQKQAADKDYTGTTPSPSPTVPWDPRCGPFWNYNAETHSCYQFRQDFVTWQEARSTCQGFKADLISVLNPHEHSYIVGRLHASQLVSIWTGLNDLEERGIWRWTDNAPLAYANWDSGYPDNRRGKDCGVHVVATTRWRTRKCDMRYGFICKKQALDLSTTTPVTKPTTPALTTKFGYTRGCHLGWDKFGEPEKCYLFAKDDKITWAEADGKCRKLGAGLVSVVNDIEQDFVEAKVKEIFKPIGNTMQDSVWLGLNARDIWNYFRWSDGSPVTFTYWDKNEPNNAGGSNPCVKIRTKNGRWWTQACDATGRGYVCKGDVSLVPKPTITPVVINCPAGTHFAYENSCYKVIHKATSWDDAEAFCSKTYKGHQVSILDRFEQAFITSKLFNDKEYGHFWIGATNRGDGAGKWRWSSGAKFQFSSWDRDFTGKEREKCATIGTGLNHGLWKTAECAERKPFVCRTWKIGFSTPAPTPPPICPRSWWDNKGYCYKVFGDSNNKASLKYWGDAVDYCRSMGAHLASIHNGDQNTFARRLLSSDQTVWLGLSKRGASDRFEWSDGSGFEFNYWDEGQPDNHRKQENCVQMDYYGRWKLAHCELAKNWLCKLKKGDPYKPPTRPPVTPRPDEHCGLDAEWKYFKGFCYYVVSDKDYDWYGALYDCQRRGGDLASIHDRDTNDLLIREVSRTNKNIFWIGLHYLDRDQYKWTDRTPFDFPNWNRGEPNDHHYGQLCVNLYAFNGFWNDDNCGDKCGYICKKANGTVTPKTTPIPKPMPGFCPKGFYGVGNKCFGVFGSNLTGRLDFDKAVKACRDRGKWYDLASINSDTEQGVVNSLLKGVNDGAWLGLTNRVHGNLQWLDNSALSFANWARHQPNGRDKCTEVLVSLHSLGRWRLSDCGEKHGYVCAYYKTREAAILTTAPLPPNKCKPGYFPYGHHCFLFSKAMQTRSVAETACQADGGHLATISDLSEHSFSLLYLRKIMKVVGPVWIGLSYDPEKDAWLWSDGWPVTFTKWRLAPVVGDKPVCVTTLDTTEGYWNATTCSLQYPSLCRTSTVPVPTTPAVPPGRCPDDTWKYMFSQYCYKFVAEDKHDFGKAATSCESDEASLVSIETVYDNLYISWMLDQSDPPRDAEPWIGLQRKGIVSPWVWLDGTPVTYTNWAAPEDRNKSDCYCAFMDVLTGKWKAGHCAAARSGRICKTSQIPITQKPGPGTTKMPTVRSSRSSSPGGSTRSMAPTWSPFFPSRKSTVGPSVPTRSTEKPRPTLQAGGLAAGAKVAIGFAVVGAVLVILIVVLVALRRQDKLSPGKYRRDSSDRTVLTTDRNMSYTTELSLQPVGSPISDLRPSEY